MKIAFDTSPLSTGHRFRGTGFYTLHLKNALEKYFPNHSYTFFENKKEIPKDADIIHYPYFDPFALSVPFTHVKKTLVTVLDLVPLIFPKAFPAGIKGQMKWQVQKFLLKQLGGIITDSVSAKNDSQRLAGIQENRISVAYLAAGEEFRMIEDKGSMIRKKYRLPEKFALYVGDVTWNKNVPRIVAAALQAGIPLVMAGKALASESFDRNNAWNADLMKVQRMVQGQKSIYRLGFVPDEDLVALYNSATVFVMPSLYEGFGLPILEAMACGCPVITAKEGSLPEVAGDAACFVDAHSVDDIAKGIQEVFQSVALRQTLAKKGLEQAGKFTWEKTAAATIQAYESVCKKT